MQTKTHLLLSWLLPILLVSSLHLSAQTKTAQTKTETLTNASVISLHKAGLDDGIIISKIEASACKFDLSTNGLIALKNAGLSRQVIAAMMEKAPANPSGGKPDAANNGTANKPPASRKSVPEPETINHVHAYDAAAQSSKPLERGLASQKVKKKVLGYAGTRIVFELKGNASPVRLRAGQNVFIVNVGNGPGDAFVLYKADVKNGVREAITAGYDAFGGTKGAKGTIALEVKQIKQGIYELTPTEALEKGEYLFIVKTATNAAAGSVDVYAFGID